MRLTALGSINFEMFLIEGGLVVGCWFQDTHIYDVMNVFAGLEVLFYVRCWLDMTD